MDLTIYTDNAENCFRMARKAKRKPEEQAWLHLSQSWVQLARRRAAERAWQSDVQPVDAAAAESATTPARLRP